MNHLDLASDKNKDWFIMHIVALWEISEHQTGERESWKNTSV